MALHTYMPNKEVSVVRLRVLCMFVYITAVVMFHLTALHIVSMYVCVNKDIDVYTSINRVM